MLFRAILEIIGAVCVLFLLYYIRFCIARRLYCRSALKKKQPCQKNGEEGESHAGNSDADQ